jgi:hypothetical protein
MNGSQLGKALGISGSMVSRLAKRGMPTDSVDKAMRWRARHLEFARVKGVRPDTVNEAVPATSTPSAAMRHVDDLMRLAQQLLASGVADAVVVELRAALRAVPSDYRQFVLVDLDVMNLLCAEVIATFERESTGAPEEKAPMNEDEEDEMCVFWYQVAAGEIVANTTAVE